MSFIAKVIDSIIPASFGRRGTYRCQCGAVQATIHVPPSSQVVDQNQARCHCPDCVGWVESLKGGGSKFVDNYTTHMVNFYKSDVTIVKGRDKIAAIQQHDNSILVRAYCVECETPLGCDLPRAPMTLLYPQNFVDGPIYIATIVLFRKYAPANARPYGPGITVCHTIWEFSQFLWRISARFLVGMVLGKNHGGLLCGDYSKVQIGRAASLLDASNPTM